MKYALRPQGADTRRWQHMARTRIASVALAAELMFSSDCCSSLRDWFCHDRCHRGCECDCMSMGSVAQSFDGPVVAPPGGYPMPTFPPATGPAPRVVPIPQANPIPATPTRLFRQLDVQR